MSECNNNNKRINKQTHKDIFTLYNSNTTLLPAPAIALLLSLTMTNHCLVWTILIKVAGTYLGTQLTVKQWTINNQKL